MIYGKTAYHRRNAATGRIKAARGFSIVELMVALTIGLIILVFVAQIFSTSRNSYGLEENMARVQESGRFAMEFLADDIRMIGYTGCNSQMTAATPDGSGNCPQNTVCSIASNTNAWATFNPIGITASKYTGSGSIPASASDWTPSLPSSYFTSSDFTSGTGGILPYGDVLIVQHASTIGTHLTGNTAPTNANIQILSSSDLANLFSQTSSGYILMVSDCKNADIFQNTNASSGSGKITLSTSQGGGDTQNFLTHSYGNDAQLYQLVSTVYYLCRGSDGQPNLCRKTLVNNAGTPTLQTQRLVSGIERMVLRYGVDTDTPADKVPNIYQNAATVSSANAWANVDAVRVGLLARTPAVADQSPDAQTYTLANTSVGPLNDKYRRHAFNATIRIRNR